MGITLHENQLDSITRLSYPIARGDAGVSARWSLLSSGSDRAGSRPHDCILGLGLVPSNASESGEAWVPILAELKEAIVDDTAKGRRIVSLRIRHACTDTKDGATRHASDERASASFVSSRAISVPNHLGFGIVPVLELEKCVAAPAFVL